MSDNSFSSAGQDYDSKYTVSNFHHDVVTALADLQSHKRVTESELNSIRVRIESNAVTTQEQLRTLETNVTSIRDMARDAMHISIGVDGKNGLRGSLESIVRDVTAITEDFEFLRHTANSYIEIRTFLTRLFIASAATILLQFGGAVWYISSQHSRQESIRNDLNRVLTYIDKRAEDSSRQALK